MIFNLFRKPAVAPDALYEAYGSIVAQSRQVKFYAEWGVPDTVTGRFDMISLHMALMMRRLKGDPTAREFAQLLVELFFRDMDRSIRELGVTDLGVPKKIKKMGYAYNGLVAALDTALTSGDRTSVEAVLLRNIYDAPHEGTGRLADYLISEAARLDGLAVDELTHAAKGAAA